MPDTETDTIDFLAAAGVEVQIHYALACAIAERSESHRFWSTPDPDTRGPRNVTLAASAAASVKTMEKLRDDIAAGRVKIIRESDEQPVAAHTLPYNGDPGDGTAPSHRDW